MAENCTCGKNQFVTEEAFHEPIYGQVKVDKVGGSSESETQKIGIRSVMHKYCTACSDVVATWNDDQYF